jgi:tetratricopeptide (TPR) repeat protein
MDVVAPGECDRLIAAGHELEDRGEFEAALECYPKAVAMVPDSPRAHMNVGNALQHLERRDAAIEAQRRAVSCAPDYAPAHFNLGALLNKRGETEKAEGKLLEALRLQPSMKEAAVLLADLYELNERFHDAELYYRRALELAPNHAAPLLNCHLRPAAYVHILLIECICPYPAPRPAARHAMNRDRRLPAR